MQINAGSIALGQLFYECQNTKDTYFCILLYGTRGHDDMLVSTPSSLPKTTSIRCNCRTVGTSLLDNSSLYRELM
ncbi:hypothetical protein DL89DRAFT_20890 [Linderina pennispora]|uniref:Uncharacterized protein n=1 Tax=Linderina pennispora TaxID=61395 RepID=A0A1Y1WM63_9FUNG|nr:uncharacterized protein DL89DRAFT_20890 [Linderina pennispora]ORX74661.1 hypothetical protein DL89DRAFT_20890 [Linderina pennispora]